jgi:hypothetical protein
VRDVAVRILGSDEKKGRTPANDRAYPATLVQNSEVSSAHHRKQLRDLTGDDD